LFCKEGRNADEGRRQAEKALKTSVLFVKAALYRHGRDPAPLSFWRRESVFHDSKKAFLSKYLIIFQTEASLIRTAFLVSAVAHE
jgi:hypothetical protein